MKRVTKAEIMDFHQFCCHRQSQHPNLPPYPTLPSPTRSHSNRSQEYDEEPVYSRPTSSISSTPTYTSDGPQTPYRSRSPMNMDEIVSYKIGGDGSPDPTMPSLVSPNPDRVKRKAIPSPRPPQGSAGGIGHYGLELPGPRETPELRVGSIELKYSLPPIPLSETDPRNTKGQEHEAPPAGNSEPSPLPVPARAVSGVPAFPLFPTSYPEPGSGNAKTLGQDSYHPRHLDSSPLPGHVTADTLTPVSPVAPASYPVTDLGDIKGPGQEASFYGDLMPSPLPIQSAAHIGEPTLPLSTNSYPETESRHSKEVPRNQGPISGSRGFENIPLPVHVTADTSVPAIRKTLPSNAEDCTLELVKDLRNSETKAPEANHSQEDIAEPQIPNRPSPLPPMAFTDIEPGLELVTTYAAPSTRLYSHPERPEPDSVSVRQSIRSSASNGKSKLRFFKRLAVSKNGSSSDQVAPIPLGLQHCFSLCAQSLLLWSRKDSDFIVRISHPFKTGQKLNLRDPYVDPSTQQKGFSIRLVAANSRLIAAYVYTNKV
jgi:hypothetical protein